MAAIVTGSSPKAARSRARGPIPPLENGDHLSAAEFLRRYEAMPDLKKAELIEGTVYVPPPVSLEHAEPDTITQGWLLTYAAYTPGTRAATNVTIRLDAENVPQPDSSLRLLPECGGQSRPGPEGYLVGAPELIVEIAASSVAIDLHGKLRSYRRAGVREYLVWRTRENEFDWFIHEQDEYRRNQPDSHHLLHSPYFPGLVLDVRALLDRDAAKVLEVLQAAMQEPAHAAFVAQLAKNK
jgi:Uma2 family endonuclease